MCYKQPMLWWLVYEIDGKRHVWIEEACDLPHARSAASLHDARPDAFVEGHRLEPRIARKLTEDLIGRRIGAAEATRQLRMLSR